MLVRSHVFIEGKVQGVSFRWMIFIKAHELQVNGWVKNLVDGRVEAMFEGEQQSVEEMIVFCRRGPLEARVARVQVIWENQLENSPRFEIR